MKALFNFGIIMILSMALVSGCTSAILPLCPKIAAVSYPQGEEQSPVNFYLINETKRSNLKLSILSPFAIELRGSLVAMNRIKRNYPHFLCAFDPKQEQSIKAAYMTCITYAPKWIDSIQSKEPQYLMLEENYYFERCIIQR